MGEDKRGGGLGGKEKENDESGDQLGIFEDWKIIFSVHLKS